MAARARSSPHRGVRFSWPCRRRVRRSALLDALERRQEQVRADEVVEALPLVAGRVVDDHRRQARRPCTCPSPRRSADPRRRSRRPSPRRSSPALAMTRGSENVSFAIFLQAPHHSAVKSTIIGRFSPFAFATATGSECSHVSCFAGAASPATRRRDAASERRQIEARQSRKPPATVSAIPRPLRAFTPTPPSSQARCTAPSARPTTTRPAMTSHEHRRRAARATPAPGRRSSGNRARRSSITIPKNDFTPSIHLPPLGRRPRTRRRARTAGRARARRRRRRARRGRRSASGRSRG